MTLPIINDIDRDDRWFLKFQDNSQCKIIKKAISTSFILYA